MMIFLRDDTEIISRRTIYRGRIAGGTGRDGWLGGDYPQRSGYGERHLWATASEAKSCRVHRAEAEERSDERHPENQQERTIKLFPSIEWFYPDGESTTTRTRPMNPSCAFASSFRRAIFNG
jgi:hypothetical protein